MRVTFDINQGLALFLAIAVIPILVIILFIAPFFFSDWREYRRLKKEMKNNSK